MTEALTAIIDAAWDARDGISSATQGEVRDAVETALAGLDDGSLRVAEKLDGAWHVNQWLKKAVLLSFRLNDNVVVDGGAAGAPAYDKVPSKFAGWGENRFRDAGFRVVPGAVARRGIGGGSEEGSGVGFHGPIFCLMRQKRLLVFSYRMINSAKFAAK